MQWRKWNRIIHRDLGYFVVGMTLIYALSGIAINHGGDWEPSYTIERKEFSLELPKNIRAIKKAGVIKLLEPNNILGYRKHYFPSDSTLKIYTENGIVKINTNTKKTIYEILHRRPVLHQINFLHYNLGKGWIYFADFFAISLILVAISGLFILKGKQGIKGRGAWLTIGGFLLPIIYLLIAYK